MAKAAVNTNGNGASTSAAARAEKVQKSSATYVATIEGKEKEFNFPNPLATIVRTTFSNGSVRDLNVDEMNDEITNCAVLQGFARRLQTSYQGEKDVDKCVEAVDEVITDLKNGVWIAPKDGPRVMVVANAVKRSIIASEGEGSVSEDRFKSIVEKLKTEEGMAKALKHKGVLSAIEDIKFENQKKRRDDAKAAMKGETASLDF